MRKCSKILGAFSMNLASLLGFVEACHAQGSPVTAIDILLEPDATMVQHAQADNARLLKAYPDGFALDATHHPHITMLQQFVRTADLGKVYTAANRILANEKVTSWNLKAFKYYYIPVPPNGIAGIVVEPTENLLRLQQALDVVKRREPTPIGAIGYRIESAHSRLGRGGPTFKPPKV